MNIVGRVSSHAALGPFIVHRDAVDLDAKTHGGPQRRMTQITGHEPIMLRRHPTSSLISNPELPYRHHAKPNKPDPGNHFRKQPCHRLMTRAESATRKVSPMEKPSCRLTPQLVSANQSRPPPASQKNLESRRGLGSSYARATSPWRRRWCAVFGRPGSRRNG